MKTYKDKLKEIFGIENDSELEDFTITADMAISIYEKLENERSYMPKEGKVHYKEKNIPDALITILSISRRGIKYKIHCPHCGKKIGFFYGREATWASCCQHCGEIYSVNVKLKK